MPLEFVTDSFLPSEVSAGVTGLKKLCCSSRKPVGNDRDKAGVVNQAYIFACLAGYVEGLFYLIALLFLRTRPACPFCLLAIDLTPIYPKRFDFAARRRIEQESGRQKQEMFIEYNGKEQL